MRQVSRAAAENLSDADRATLGFLAEHRVGIAPQLALWLGVSVSAASRRVQRLADRKLLVSQGIFSRRPQTVQITAAGLRAIGSELPAPHWSFDGYRHDLGVGWLWVAARDGVFGELDGALSERRMQSADARRGRTPGAVGALDGTEAGGVRPPYGVGIGGVGPTGLPQRHYPDLMLQLASGETVALELELTSKGPRRLAGIMRGYAGDRRIDTVLYLVPNRRLGSAIALAARRAGISALIRVELLAGGGAIEGAPPIAGRPSHGRPAQTTGRRPGTADTTGRTRATAIDDGAAAKVIER